MIFFILVDSMTQCNLKQWWVIFRHVPFPLPLVLSLDDVLIITTRHHVFVDWNTGNVTTTFNVQEVKWYNICKDELIQLDAHFFFYTKMIQHKQRWTYTAWYTFFAQNMQNLLSQFFKLVTQLQMFALKLKKTFEKRLFMDLGC